MTTTGGNPHHQLVRFLETEYDLEVSDLHLTRIRRSGSWLVEGTAHKAGEAIPLSGTVNVRNLSSVKVGHQDDPFTPAVTRLQRDA